MLRNRSDLRSVGYLAATVGLFLYQWTRPGLCNWWLYPLTLAFCFTAAVQSHNHNHTSMWRWQPLNLMTSYVIGFFYGFPAFAWIPTHNQNHHHYNNKPGDELISPRYFRRNHLLALLVYPPITELAQFALLRRYMVDLARRDRPRLWAALSEYAVFFTGMALALALDWRKAVVLLVLPQVFGKYFIQCVSYFQHVDCEPDSEWNHSRNFVGPLVNAMLFNNGFHTVHHLKPGVHWSELPALHAQYADRIDSSLQQPSLPGWILYTFIVGPARGWLEGISGTRA